MLDSPQTDRDQEAQTRLARLINTRLSTIEQPLIALALHYETAQGAPWLYLAYETIEHLGERLMALGQPAAIDASAAVLARSRKSDIDDKYQHNWERSDAISGIVSPIFDPGSWYNPADPVLIGMDPIVDAWARELFLCDMSEDARSSMSETALGAALKRLRDQLWLALDQARATCVARWPAIAFVHSFDDDAVDLLYRIANRTDDLSPFR